MGCNCRDMVRCARNAENLFEHHVPNSVQRVVFNCLLEFLLVH